MQKKLIYIFTSAILIAAFVFSLPFLMGMLAENKFTQVIETIAGFSNAEIKITNYQRHWFDSDATITVTMHPRTAASLYNQASPSDFSELQQIIENSQINQFSIKAHILHGPIIFTDNKIRFAQAIINSDINLTPEQNALFNLPTPNTAIASFQTVIRLDGSSVLTVNVIPFTYQEKTTASIITSKDISLQMRFSATMNKMDSNFYLQNFNAKSDTTVLNINELKSEYNATKTITNLWVGEKNTSLTSFSLNSPDVNLLLENLNLNSSSKEDKGLISSATTVAMNNLMINGEKYGPNNFAWTLNKLNAAVLSKIKQQARLLRTQKPVLLQSGKLLNLFLQLINNGAEIDISKFEINTPNGKIDLKAHVVFANQPNNNIQSTLSSMNLDLELIAGQKIATNLAEKIYSVISNKPLPLTDTQQKTPSAVVPEVSSTTVVSAPVDTNNQADQLLANLVTSGVFISESDNFKLHLTYTNGNLLINGKSPLQMVPLTFNPGPALMPTATTTPTAPATTTK